MTFKNGMRLARYFIGDAESWLNLQSTYELRKASLEDSGRVDQEVEPAPFA